MAQGLDRAVGGNQPGGATGSSYATAGGGLAAYSALLSHYHYGVERQRGSIAQHQPPDNATVFVLEPSDLTVDDASALLQFATAGGRLVVGGESPFYLRSLRDTAPQWQPAGTTSWTTVDPSLGNVRDIEGAGVGSWSSSGSGRALVGRDGFALLTRDQVGRGEIFFLADASPLENAYLGAGGQRRVRARAGGRRRAPSGRLRRRCARLRREPWPRRDPGPVEGRVDPGRRRRARVRVVAPAGSARPTAAAATSRPPAPSTCRRCRSASSAPAITPAHWVPAQRWARARVAARAGLGAKASEEDLARAARSFGCAPDEIAALLAPVSDDASVLALGRAVARVGGDGRMQ